jgi:hypothetical protein
MLTDLLGLFGWVGIVSVLGVSRRSLVDWVRGQAPSDAARRAIWLVWCLTLHPDRLQSVFDLCTWGRFRQSPASVSDQADS